MILSVAIAAFFDVQWDAVWISRRLVLREFPDVDHAEVDRALDGLVASGFLQRRDRWDEPSDGIVCYRKLRVR